MCTLAKLLESKIKRLNPKSPTYEADVEDIRAKLDVFYAADRISQEEYNYLVGLLEGNNV